MVRLFGPHAELHVEVLGACVYFYQHLISTRVVLSQTSLQPRLYYFGSLSPYLYMQLQLCQTVGFYTLGMSIDSNRDGRFFRPISHTANDN